MLSVPKHLKRVDRSLAKFSWEYDPQLAAIGVFLLTAASLIFQPNGKDYFFDYATPSFANGLLAYFFLRLSKKYIKVDKYRFFVFLSISFILTILIITISLFLIYSPFVPDQPIRLNIFRFIRIWTGISVLMAITGVTSVRMRKLNLDLSEAREIAESQRAVLLESKEKLQLDLSKFIHDRLQSELYLLGLKFSEFNSEVSAEHRERFNTLIVKLEDLRGNILSNLALSLNPEIGFFGLQHAFENLIKTFESVLSIEYSFEPQSAEIDQEESKTLLLATYRISEQVITNAVFHGKAKNCKIAISYLADQINIQITNDGERLPDGPLSIGLGFATIQTWAHKYDGVWDIKNNSVGQVEFKATLFIARN